MSIYRKLIVKPGSKISLKDFAPNEHGTYRSHEAARQKIAEHLQTLDQLQYLLYAERKHALLIILQGLDSAGKDGVIRHVLSGVNPQGCVVTGFKQPTPDEAEHDFLWRVHPHAPGKGGMAIFNRSHYEDVLVVRVHSLVSKRIWSTRYDQINEFERLLVRENDTTILKFFLHISKDEQLSRFKTRLEDPARNWKISESDYSEREYWGAYQEAYGELLQKTSTDHAPWFIVPSNHKWFRDLVISQLIVEALQDMNMKTPAATVNLAEIRKKYHLASSAQKASGRRTK